ncbi:hypothetical protein FHR24_000784 [Wenyingzhuangia heitensis]|uniref:Lipoprotein n=1 Tax=Wenyingzhuangia heitensis TaxID=1487859 RepID=A0ABX0U8T6_9FLAO|nr:hypothetical protein [Wenyingzhuangia heitensis]NIJ44345.1 hypothetical protein [Wenyingzhuangia heitensis]
MQKYGLLAFFCLIVFTACKSNQQASVPQNKTEITLPFQQNDSIEHYKKVEANLIQKVEAISSYQNPITTHFKKHISRSALKAVEFKEWRKNIYVEFTLDKYKRLTSIVTNTSSLKLDKQLKKTFKKLSFESLKIQNFDPKYKYSLVVIQNLNGIPVVKSNTRAIGYIPPIYELCSDEVNYHNLNKCNYMYITNYLYNHIDLSFVSSLDIDNNHEILPKFIIDKTGKVAAAMVESQNKDLLESFYKAIMSLPKASLPAKLNGKNDYYGYNFPTSIKNIIRNNNDFKKFYYQRRFDKATVEELMKEFVAIEYQKKQHKLIYKVGF